MVSEVVDLRSDTVTKPTEAMRKAMAAAEVGDDVFGDDPTVLELERRVAQILGKEAAVFVPSGTMANLLAVLTHCPRRASEIIAGDQSHIVCYEQGGVSAVAGVMVRTIPTNDDGTLDLDLIDQAIRRPDSHAPRTALLCLENTHNRKGGRVIGPKYFEQVAALAKEKGLKIHVDGARIWNAAASIRVSVCELVVHCDSVSVCFSKGLGAPVGSCLVGSREFIQEARYLRKGLGGTMRQVGVLAAAALVGLEQIYPLLGRTHEQARTVCSYIFNLNSPRLAVVPAACESNLLYINTEKGKSQDFVKFLGSDNILAIAVSSDCIRLAFHHQISDSMIDHVLRSIDKFTR